jgi:hypothetical protein
MGREPLNYKILEGMEKDEREAAIIKRANFYMQFCRPPGIDTEAYEAAINQARDGFMLNQFLPKKQLEFPHQ